MEEDHPMTKEEILESDIIGFLRINNGLSIEDALKLREALSVTVTMSLDELKELVNHCKK
jgi:hypothetical protein